MPTKKNKPSSTGWVAELLDLTKSKVEYYKRQGIVIPSEKDGGRGSFNLYTNENLVEIMIAKNLSEQGVRIETLKVLFDAIRLTMRAKKAGVDTANQFSLNPLQKKHPEYIQFLVIWRDKDGSEIPTLETHKGGEPIILNYHRGGISGLKAILVLNIDDIIADVAERLQGA